MPAKDRPSSLIRTIVNYGRKKFYNIGPRIVQPSVVLVSGDLTTSYEQLEDEWKSYKVNETLVIVTLQLQVTSYECLYAFGIMSFC